MKNSKILNIVASIERVIIIVLLFALLTVVIYSTVVFLILLYDGITYTLNTNITQENNILIYLHTIFGGFMLVLIGIELLHTVKIYLKENTVKAEVVLLVALIGLARHIIDLDLHLDPISYIGIGVLLIALAGSYYLIRKTSND
ncbi:phosphate-starvation-inducible PsiE family protein [Winogradskyella sp. J14-2]|uniref:phosphate-starvation-inducible PsiE family protein n=1 Tax=Winogradskyella sp. J14-2 TaxID=1936080 RepID=UPI0009FB1231|nr:phosphate-starvation-inducible PsiE family protein [Winogradskyella sp. J14-2]